MSFEERETPTADVLDAARRGDGQAFDQLVDTIEDTVDGGTVRRVENVPEAARARMEPVSRSAEISTDFSLQSGEIIVLGAPRIGDSEGAAIVTVAVARIL